MKNFLKKFYTAPKNILVLTIRVYQYILSPDHSWISASFPYGYCRHYPSCSEYTKQAVEKFGVFKGMGLGLKRVGRCHPWAESKFDPIPNQ